MTTPARQALITTLKVAPVFPERFGSLDDARTFMATFVEGDHHHRHTGIGLNTPAHVHCGHGVAKATERSGVLAEAHQCTLERFATTARHNIDGLDALTRLTTGNP